MIEINLIPDVKRELLRAQRMRNTVISISIITSIAAGAVVVLLALYVFGVQAARGAVLDNQVKNKSTELSQVEDLSKILTIQNQLASINDLSQKKLVSSRLFDMISAVTTTGNDQVSFSQISLSPTVEEATGAATGADDGTGTGPATGTGTDTGTSGPVGGTILIEGQVSSYSGMEALKKTIENTSIVVTSTEEGVEPQLIPIASNVSTTDMSYGEDSSGKRVVRFTISFEYAGELFASHGVSGVAFKRTINGNVTDSYLGIPRFAERAKDVEGGN